ncbi:MAG TPA: bifunctional nuclease family protein, partial [Ktedonobacteraceae bacterium]
QGTSSQRPLTHDLLNNVIHDLGANIESVVISDLIEDIFYARIVMDVDGRHVEVDSRPSDAIALAVRAKVPIYVEDSVLERAGMALESNEDSITSKSDSPIEQDDENLDAYRDFINSLDVLDEFGKD